MSLIKKLTGIAYSGGVKVRRDKVINDGTQFMFDFANSFCSPLTGSLSAGTTIANLVDSAPVATAAGSGAAVFDTKGLVFDGTSTIRLDLGTTYSLATTDADFLYVIWLSHPATRNTGAEQGVFGLAYSSSDNEFLVRQNGANNLIFYVDSKNVYWAASASSIVLPTTTAVAATQYAVAWIKTTGGVNIECYLNGVLQNSIFNADSDLTPVSGSNNGIRLGNMATQLYPSNNQWKGTVHRAFKENLTLSGATAASQVALDYARNSTRFV